ncbi:MAG: Ig-like domain-containing protein [Clostridia bacterium]|nr:Ig-like domain-containing protein [Clostridia bacterium]
MENETTPKCRECGSTDVGARYDGQSFCRSCGAIVAPCAVCGSYDIAKGQDGAFFCRACGARGAALEGRKTGKISFSGKKRAYLLIGAVLAALLIAVVLLFATGVFGGGSLIGKWAFGANHWQFNDDGTFSANINTLNYEGTYTAEDGKLHIDTDFFGLKKSLDYDYAIKGKKLTLTGDVTLTGAGSMTLEYERISNKSASSGKKPGDTTAAPTNDPGNTAEETGKAGIKPTETKAAETKAAETTEPAETTIPVSSVSLNESNITLTAGETATLSCSVLPENATDQTVSWASSNTAVATVENGTVTAQAQGFAVILAKTADGKTAECWVTVTDNDDFEFERIENGGGYRLVKYYGSDASVVIPSTYNGKIVTEIGRVHFYGSYSNYMFTFSGSQNIEAITIPNTVTCINQSAFSGCNGLKTVYFSGTKAQWRKIFRDTGKFTVVCSDGTLTY